MVWVNTLEPLLFFLKFTLNFEFCLISRLIQRKDLTASKVPGAEADCMSTLGVSLHDKIVAAIAIHVTDGDEAPRVRAVVNACNRELAPTGSGLQQDRDARGQ